MSYAFKGDAAFTYTEISAEMPEASVSEVWSEMDNQLENTDLIASQRKKLHAASLEPKESVTNLVCRLQRLVIGLPELRGSAKMIFLKKKPKEALPRNLRKQFVILEQTHSLESAGAALAQIE